MIRRRRLNSFTLNWPSWLVVFCVIGYPLIGIFGSLLNLDSSVLSIPFRIFVVALSIAVFFLTRSSRGWLRSQLWLLAFLAMYLIRLISDWLLVGIPGAVDALVFFIGVALLPSLALARVGIAAIPQRLTAWLFIVVGGTTCTLASTISYFGLRTDRMVDIENTIGRIFFLAVNPISLGHVAVTTLIAILFLGLHPMGPLRRLALLIFGAAAIVTLMGAASRGPLIALVICIIAFGIASGRWRWIALLALVMVPLILSTNNLLIQRLLNVAEDESALERLSIQNSAITQFFNNPILGSAYTELLSLEYPHNLFIETAMALGIVGLTLLMLVLLKTFRAAWRSIGHGKLLLALLLLQYFIAQQFSGAIWGASSLLILIALFSGKKVSVSHPG